MLRRRLLAAGLLPLMTGCFSGSLATSTGPRAAGDWSVASKQAAHVGEPVRFSFILTKPFQKQPVHPSGIADYCILSLDGAYAEASLEVSGKFTALYRVPAAWRGREVQVRATAYRHHGQADTMVVGDKLRQVDDPGDLRDTKVAQGKITLLAYQSVVELTLTAGAEDLDFDTGRLVLRKTDGTATPVMRARPPMAGFTVEGPDAKRQYTVRYEPTWEQVNLTGTTAVEFTVLDRAGHEHRAAADILTP
jgi:hypothetical protein